MTTYLINCLFLFSSAPVPWSPWIDSDPPDNNTENELARQAFKSVYTFTPWREAQLNEDDQRGISLIDGVYDGMTMYIHAIKGVLQVINDAPIDNQILKGSEIVNKIIGRKFPGNFHVYML